MQALAYAPDQHGRQAEQQIIIEILRADPNTPWSRNQLAEQLKHIEPQALGAALDLLVGRGVLHVDGETIDVLDGTSQRDRLDALSGVVVHVLVSEHPQVMTLAEIAEPCERDLDKPDERHEIELALRWITGDGLAVSQDGGWIATRPAVRAAELSF